MAYILTWDNHAELNVEWLTRKAEAREKIHLIKALREVSGLSLADAKTAIENTQGYWIDSPINIGSLIRLFYTFVAFPLPTQPVAPQPVAPQPVAPTLLDSIKCAIDNWQSLGFNSPFDAIRFVVDNLERKTKP